MRIDGRCHCGAIAYEAEIDPAQVMVCHCTDCQTLSGSAFRIVALTRPGSFRLLAGTMKTYVKTAESGARRLQCFCPDCGTPICAMAEGAGEDPLRIALDGGHGGRPAIPDPAAAAPRRPRLRERTGPAV
jgi:hypothetical protein